MPLCPALRPRADLRARPVAALRCCPRNSYNEGSPINKHFGALSHGFTTRCLRLKTPFPNANQGSLPVDGQSFPGGIVPRRVSPEAFSCSLRHRLLSVCCFSLRAPSPPLRALAGAKETAFPSTFVALRAMKVKRRHLGPAGRGVDLFQPSQCCHRLPGGALPNRLKFMALSARRLSRPPRSTTRPSTLGVRMH